MGLVPGVVPDKLDTVGMFVAAVALAPAPAAVVTKFVAAVALGPDGCLAVAFEEEAAAVVAAVEWAAVERLGQVGQHALPAAHRY